MRITFLILIVAGLVYAGWEKPLEQRSPWYQPPPAPQPVARAAPTPRGGWMWDKTRKTPLDRPAYNHVESVTGQTTYFYNGGTTIIAPQSPGQSASDAWMWDGNRHTRLDSPKHSPSPSPLPH